MPKISPLGQKLWPTGREQTDTHANTEDPFFENFLFDFRFSFKGAVRKDIKFLLIAIIFS